MKLVVSSAMFLFHRWDSWSATSDDSVQEEERQRTPAPDQDDQQFVVEELEREGLKRMSWRMKMERERLLRRSADDSYHDEVDGAAIADSYQRRLSAAQQVFHDHVGPLPEPGTDNVDFDHREQHENPPNKSEARAEDLRTRFWRDVVDEDHLPTPTNDGAHDVPPKSDPRGGFWRDVARQKPPGSSSADGFLTVAESVAEFASRRAAAGGGAESVPAGGKGLKEKPSSISLPSGAGRTSLPSGAGAFHRPPPFLRAPGRGRGPHRPQAVRKGKGGGSEAPVSEATSSGSPGTEEVSAPRVASVFEFEYLVPGGPVLFGKVRSAGAGGDQTPKRRVILPSGATPKVPLRGTEE